MLMPNEVPGMWRRLIALVLDLLVLSLANVALSGALREITAAPIAVIVADYFIMLVYSVVFLSQRGQTVGKMLMGLRVISPGGGAVTQQQAFIRSLVKWTPIFTILILQAALAPPAAGPEQAATRITEAPVEQAEVAPETVLPAMAVSFVGMIIALILILITRRHPDRQAPHDRVSDTFVTRLP